MSYLTSPKHLFHPSQEGDYPLTKHLIKNPFANCSDPFTPTLPHDRVESTCQLSDITRCCPVQGEIEMHPECASTVLRNSAKQNKPKGAAIYREKSLYRRGMQSREEWSQVWWDQWVKSFLCMIGSCTGLCGWKTFPYQKVYEKDRDGVCWWNKA